MHRRLMGVASAMLALVITACAGTAGSAEPSTAASTTPPTSQPSTSSAAPSATAEPADPNLVAIGDRSLWLECTGEGSPTIVMESGLGGDHRTWERVAPELSSSARVCVYDRAGIADSDPAPGTRTAADAVDDVRALLGAAGIAPPYVLVGFSYGGIITQLHASMYPDEVAGIVLVESNHPLEAAQFADVLTPEQVEADREAALGNPEGLDVFAGMDEAAAAGPLPDVPLVVVTAGISEGWPPDFDAETLDALRAAQQADLATFTSQGSQVIAESSAHHVPSQEPGTIVRAIEQVLDLIGG
jgi:pimeloyl-ACP methyl ester carboxylesterase